MSGSLGVSGRDEGPVAASQCEANVWVRPGYWHKFRCKRKATAEVMGLRLCTQHAKIVREKGLAHVR